MTQPDEAGVATPMVSRIDAPIESVELSSEMGPIIVATRDGAVCGLAWTDGFAAIGRRIRAQHPDSPWRAVSRVSTAEPVRAYLDGDLDALEIVEVDVAGTPFQTRVWSELRRIPVGTTISYGELAGRVERPTASRAVGAANGANPVSLVNPCHRVIAANGTLGGYGGGLDRKAWLLRHEGALL